MATRLDKYKIDYNCQYDGETVLRAAEMGHFSERYRSVMSVGTKSNVGIRQSLDEFVKKLGVTKKMKRDEIVEKLHDLTCVENYEEFDKLIRAEAKKLRPRIKEILKNIIPHPTARKTYKDDILADIIREKIESIIYQIIDFCYDDILE